MIFTTYNKYQLDHLVEPHIAAAIHYMMEKIYNHRWRHEVRQAYVDGVKRFDNLGIAIPPQLSDLEVALGFPSKAIDSVSQRIMLDGYSLPNAVLSDFGIDEIIEDNLLLLENKRAHASALLQASVFQSVTYGDTSIGEPEVVIQSFEATMATGIYNGVTKRLSAALTIIDEDFMNGGVKRFIAYFPDAILDFRLDETFNSWSVDGYHNPLGEVPVVPLTYGATLTRPFGKSYLSREMMNLTDHAARTVARNETAAEFFTTPQRYILGADPSAFVNDDGTPATEWDLTMGRLLSLNSDEDGNGLLPQVGTFEASDPTNGIALFTMYAAQFAAAAKLPLQSLGIEHANPASAEGVHAVREDLFKSIEDANRDFSVGHKRVMQLAVKMKLGVTELPEEMKSLTINWRNPATPSITSAADAALKLVSAGIIPADSDIAMRRAGLTDAEIQEVRAHRTRTGDIERVKQLLSLRSEGVITNVNQLAQESPVGDR